MFKRYSQEFKDRAVRCLWIVRLVMARFDSGKRSMKSLRSRSVSESLHRWYE